MTGRARRTRGEAPVPAPEETSESLTLFDNMSDDTRVMIWKWDPAKAKQVYLYTLGREDATEAKLQELTGGGKYMCKEQVRDPGSGKYLWGQQRTVEIAGPPRELREILPVPGTPPAGTVAGPGGTPMAPAPPTGRVGIDEIMSAGILQLFQASREVTTAQIEAIKAMSRPAEDWKPLLVAVLPLIEKLVGPRDTDTKLLDMLDRVTGIVKNTASPAAGLKDQLQALNEILDLKERTGGGTEERSTTDLIVEQLGKLLEVVKAEQGRRPAPAARPVGSAKPPAQVEGPAWQRALAPWRSHLLGLARTGKDPVTTGAYVVMVMPEPAKAVFREFLLGSEDPVTEIIAFLPDLGNYAHWVEELVGAVAEGMGIAGDEEPEQEDEHGEGDSDLPEGRSDGPAAE